MDIINRIGLEVEGGWDGEPYIPPFDDLDLVADGSIDGVTVQSDKPLRCAHVGEAVSSPLTRDEVEEWIKKHWPLHTNITCGYHIHVSVKKPLYYFLLTRKTYTLQLRAQMWNLAKDLKLPDGHYIWKRLDGTNPFCLLNYDASGQIGVKVKKVGMRVRYGFLNFAKNIHDTMEFRALPTFESPELALKFTNVFLDGVEEYVKSASQASLARSISLSEIDGVFKTSRKESL
jgi:hypothetical protein